MRDLLYLDNMIIPKVITLFYWTLLFIAVASGLGTMMAGNFISGLIVIAGGMFAARVWSELIIVLFKINEALQEIRTK
ncbi:MAG: hypothetical protein Q7N95_17190 [Alphaproteobacteria bacterium]|nr:hypothetical protein [Alphaproteobacteria bacterium]